MRKDSSGKMLSSQTSQICSEQINYVGNTSKPVSDPLRSIKLNFYCPLGCRPGNWAKKSSHTAYNIDVD